MAKKKASDAVADTEVQKTEKIVKSSDEAKAEKPEVEKPGHAEVSAEDVEKGSEDLKVDVEVEVDSESPKTLLFKDWLLKTHGNVPQKQNQLPRLFSEYLEMVSNLSELDTPHTNGFESLIPYIKLMKDKAIYTVKEIGELEKAYLGN